MRDLKKCSFEWESEIPSEWTETRLKDVLSKQNREILEDDQIVICSNQGKVTYRGEKNPGLVSMTESGYQGVNPGDLLIHGMDTWHGAIAVSGIRGKCTGVVHVCESHQSKSFIAYYLQSLAFRSVYKAFSNGVRQNTSDFRSWKKAGAIPIALPPLKEQISITNYLDKKCAEIDKAIDAAKASTEEYKLYKKSVIFQTVTKGLNHNVSMKDSGIEWIGMMPEAWATEQVGRRADQTKRKNDGMAETNLLSLSYGKVKRRDINATEGLLPESFEGYNIIEKNDIVLRFTDLQNDQKSLRVGRATERGIITSAYTTIRPFDSEDSKFLYYALHSYDLKKGFYGMGAGVRQGLKWQEAKYIEIPWPDNQARTSICRFLDSKCVEIDKAIEAKLQIIGELKAYKKSLIWEAVTGKREVV